jgi:hypothetical protein
MALGNPGFAHLSVAQLCDLGQVVTHCQPLIANYTLRLNHGRQQSSISLCCCENEIMPTGTNTVHHGIVNK